MKRTEYLLIQPSREDMIKEIFSESKNGYMSAGTFLHYYPQKN